MGESGDDESRDLDLVVLHGRLSSEPTERSLPSGDLLRTYEVTVREADRGAASVPVVLVGGRRPAVHAGDQVVVVGQVRRRFFRAGGTTASRTEVVADAVVAAGRRPSVDRLVARARERLSASLECER